MTEIPRHWPKEKREPIFVQRSDCLSCRICDIVWGPRSRLVGKTIEPGNPDCGVCPQCKGDLTWGINIGGPRPLSPEEKDERRIQAATMRTDGAMYAQIAERLGFPSAREACRAVKDGYALQPDLEPAPGTGNLGDAE